MAKFVQVFVIVDVLCIHVAVWLQLSLLCDIMSIEVQEYVGKAQSYAYRIKEHKSEQWIQQCRFVKNNIRLKCSKKSSYKKKMARVTPRPSAS